MHTKPTEMIHDDLRKKLALALLSAERLYLIFEATSYFDPGPTRPFLDAVWLTVSTGRLPTELCFKKVKKLIRSSAIPDEADCCGIDFYGLSFVSALDILSDTVTWEDGRSLAYLADEIEGNLLDHFLNQSLSSAYTLQDTSIEAKIAADPRMARLHKQAASDRIAIASMKLKTTALEHLKENALFHILA